MASTTTPLKQRFGSIFSSTLRGFVLLWTTVAITSCTSVFFYPDKHHRLTPDQLGLTYKDIFLTSRDGTLRHSWWLKAEKPLGTVLFLHGNAENISTHIASVHWLPSQGYNVLLLDYRGYGLSQGEPSMPEVLDDIDEAYQWIESQHPKLPTFILGQSLGGALATTFTGDLSLERRPDAVIIDAAFASFQGIAREKLGEFWLTWPLQYPLSWLVPTRYDPIDRVSKISPTPTLIIYSKADSIIPFHHGDSLYNSAMQPKGLITTQTPHIATFLEPEYRKQLLTFLKQNAAPIRLQAQFRQ